MSEVAHNILFLTHRAVIKQILQGKIPAEKNANGWWVISKAEYVAVMEDEKRIREKKFQTKILIKKTYE